VSAEGKLINTPNAARIEEDARGVSREQMARFFPVAGLPPSSLPPLPPAAWGQKVGRRDDSVPRSQAASFSPDEEKERNTGREIDGRRPSLPFALRRLPRRPRRPSSSPKETSAPPPLQLSPSFLALRFLANLRAHLGGAPAENRVASRALARTTTRGRQ